MTEAASTPLVSETVTTSRPVGKTLTVITTTILIESTVSNLNNNYIKRNINNNQSSRNISYNNNLNNNIINNKDNKNNSKATAATTATTTTKVAT